MHDFSVLFDAFKNSTQQLIYKPASPAASSAVQLHTNNTPAAASTLISISIPIVVSLRSLQQENKQISLLIYQADDVAHVHCAVVCVWRIGGRRPDVMLHMGLKSRKSAVCLHLQSSRSIKIFSKETPFILAYYGDSYITLFSIFSPLLCVLARDLRFFLDALISLIVILTFGEHDN